MQDSAFDAEVVVFGCGVFGLWDICSSSDERGFSWSLFRNLYCKHIILSLVNRNGIIFVVALYFFYIEIDVWGYMFYNKEFSIKTKSHVLIQ